MASFLKKIKQNMLPGIGGKVIGHKVFGDKGGDNGPPDLTAQYQGDLDAQQKEYAGYDQAAKEGALADAKRAGTFADTREFQTSLTGEAGARARGLKYANRLKQNALRAKLGLPSLGDNEGGPNPEGVTSQQQVPQ